MKQKYLLNIQMILMIGAWTLPGDSESNDFSPEQQQDRSPLESRHWWWWLLTSAETDQADEVNEVMHC